ncbi:thioredoxin family protein [Synoicihabitans lomoniglobus]|uniref:Thioredoxin family protein n=1 Tax=Synoicihabitans lomoniglobus TaxID=2909285 RepID=A0AAF0CP25_9BACT|nr:thioredoxin family protein [Opitutaceae bacterium LMO-M01]WED65481.1 thioredoxin family protein [Opitutaceae bacterium LMO-M01]
MKILRVLLLLGLAGSLWAAPGSGWKSDLAAAQAQAKAEGKSVLVDFTGTAWSDPWKVLNQEVYKSAEFTAWAADKILVRLDYPERNERAPAKVAANPALGKLIAIKNDFNIRGFPTLIWLNAEGEEVARVIGYREGMGPMAYIAELTKPR